MEGSFLQGERPDGVSHAVIAGNFLGCLWECSYILNDLLVEQRARGVTPGAGVERYDAVSSLFIASALSLCWIGSKRTGCLALLTAKAGQPSRECICQT